MGSILRLSPGATVVAEASDGQDAIACVREVHPDFVRIDRQIPVMDGLEATRRIKQEWPDLKMLVVPSLYGDDSRRAALAAGADGFLDKWDIATDLVVPILGPEGDAADPSRLRRDLLSHESNRSNVHVTSFCVCAVRDRFHGVKGVFRA
jgi:CheY-like chemotaxis protein